MDSAELERLLAQLEGTENGLFRLIEAEPAVIHEPKVQEALAHLKGAMESLGAAKDRQAAGGFSRN
jgi:hypothetical protein